MNRNQNRNRGSHNPNLAQLANTLMASMMLMAGQQQPGGRTRGHGHGRGKSARTQHNPTIGAVQTIAKSASRISDDRMYEVVTTTIKHVSQKIVEIARERLDDHSLKTVNDLTYGQVNDSLPAAIKAAAESSPNVFNENFNRDLEKILSLVQKNRNVFQTSREKINTEVASGKISAPVAAALKVTTGKGASRALIGMAAIGEKVTLITGLTFNSTQAQVVFQNLVGKQGVNTLFAKNEDHLKAICIYAYGPKSYSSVWQQTCSKLDMAKVAQIRAEAKTTKMGPSVAPARKSA